MTSMTAPARPAWPGISWSGRAAGWLRTGRGGLFLLALLVGAGSGLGAVAFRYLIYFFTWAATGHDEFGQQGRVGSAHLPWLGPEFLVVVPAIGGLLYGPLIYRFAREARGHGVPEVMIAVADNGGRIRPQVSAVKAVASALCIGVGGSVGREGPIVQIGSALASGLGQWVKMPENRLRILVACGAAGGISATFNAPITGVFFGVEIILRIGGSGGVFAPSLFIGVTSGMAFGDVVHHLFRAGAGQPALYAVVAMGAVFASAARAPLTSLASVVEMTGDFTLTLPVMLAVAIASTISGALSYGTIYTTKLLRRGTDISQPSARPATIRDTRATARSEESLFYGTDRGARGMKEVARHGGGNIKTTMRSTDRAGKDRQNT
jgi:H+/Cl- antiporter ClcA